jgi:alpha-2-macroglobulin-like protein
VLTKLDSLKKAEGDTFTWSSGGSQTMFYEGGSSADLSATAIAGHAFLAAGGYPEDVAGALGALAKGRDPQGNFGPTQSTVWSLRLLTLAATKGTEPAEGTVDIAVDGAKVSSVSFTKADADVLRTVDLAASATTGDHQVSLTFVGTGKPSYSLVASHNVPWSLVPSTPTGPLSVTVAYDRTSLVVDETVEATVTLTNLEANGQNMVHATVGVPPGFEVLGEDFADELESKALSHWESTAKQLELYVPVLAPSGSLAVTYRLRATMPLKAEDGGAKVFPYYQPTEQSTAPSTTLVVASK